MDLEKQSGPLLRKLLTAFLIGVLMLLAYGVWASLRSPLFSAQILEVKPQGKAPFPVSLEEIQAATGIKVGEESLIVLSLQSVEERLLRHEWVRSVRLEKKFPQTLLVEVEFREPVALFLKSDGKLAYLDVEARIFSKIRGGGYRDLPIVSGIEEEESERIARAIEVIRFWKEKKMEAVAIISSVTSDHNGETTLSIAWSGQVTEVILDYESTFDLEQQIDRISSTLRYLSDHRVSIRTLWANSGKKIVVKRVLGS